MTTISVMLAVPDAPAASPWYQRALFATELWNLGSVIGLEVGGAPFFLAQPEGNRWESSVEVGTTTVRVEVFVNDPDSSPAVPRLRGRTATIRYETIRRRGGRIDKGLSLIPTGISGWWATSRRRVACETSGHGYGEVPVAAPRTEDRTRKPLSVLIYRSPAVRHESGAR